MRLSLHISPTAVSNAWSAGRRHLSTTAVRLRAFEEGDVVLLREKKWDPSHDGILLNLGASKELSTHRGKLKHAEIIGKNVRQVVETARGHGYRIHEPTLAEYVRLSPRLVTPIYPTDANTIVSLLDIHVDTPPTVPDNSPPLEILEAGTGHGALTLHLSRAIHAANPPLPTPPPNTTSASETTDSEAPAIEEDPVYGGETVSSLADSRLETWKAARRAILHTVDASAKYSKHARKTVQAFRHGMYARNVDFHVGDVSDWITGEMAARKTTQPFLSHIFLDLPSANLHLPNVAPALHVDGLLAVFNPSITQIVECVDAVREQRLPLILDQVVELGAGSVRQWDIRSVVPRAVARKNEVGSESESPMARSVGNSDVEGDSTVDAVPEGSDAASDAGSVGSGLRARDAELEQDSAKREQQGRHTVCRPKAFERVVGGGFLGVWRKMEPPSAREPKE
jgi:tRNA A58 N-methylase Trm61